MNQSILSLQMMKSPLKQQSSLNPKTGAKKKSSLLFSLNLTALIDAFSILVIFLLSSMNDGAQNLEFKNGMILPSAQKSEVMNTGKVVRIESGRFIVDDKALTADQLLAKFIEFKKAKSDEAIIIQADKTENYEVISTIIKAAAQAGIEKYMLAVLPINTAGI
jgi:biopolymer transport protein ExbD